MGYQITSVFKINQYEKYGHYASDGSWMLNDEFASKFTRLPKGSFSVVCSANGMGNLTNDQLNELYQKTKDFDGFECRMNLLLNGVVLSATFHLFGIEVVVNNLYNTRLDDDTIDKYILAGMRALRKSLENKYIETMNEQFYRDVEKEVLANVYLELDQLFAVKS